jgi:Alpha/beta hydrolase family
MEFVSVHGTTQSAAGFGLLTERLCARGHRSVAVELPGDAPHLMIAEYAAIAAEQAAHLDHPIAVAHSAGGLLLPAAVGALKARRLVWLGALVPDLVDGRSTREQIETDRQLMFTADRHTWDDDVVEAPAISTYLLFHDCDLTTLRWALPTLQLFQPRAVFA